MPSRRIVSLPACTLYLLLTGVLLIAPGSVTAACKLLQVAEWHVELNGLQPTILGQVDGKPIRVLLDTGSYRTFLLGKDAQQLGLQLRQYSDRNTYGVAGHVATLTTLVHELKIGSLDLKNLTLYVLDTKTENRSFGMLLGADFFSAYDTEFDLAHGVVRLFQNVNCQPQQLAYWSNGYFLAKLQRPPGYDVRFRMDTKLNNRRTTAVLDSGAPLSFVSKVAAQNAGVALESDSRQPQTASGLAGTERTWEGRFDSFAIGNETIQHAKLQIGELFENTRAMRTGSMLPQKIEGMDDILMLLGVDFLLAHHVMILPHEHEMLFTYNGGPIFRTPTLDETRTVEPTGQATNAGTPIRQP